MIKKISRWSLVGIFIFVFGGFGGIFFGKYLLPTLGKNSFLGKYHIFQQMEQNTTVINKTETVVVRNDNLINEISSNVASSVVTIFSFVDDKELSSKKYNLIKKKKNITKEKEGAGVVLTNDGIIVTYESNIIKEKAIYQIAIFDGSIHGAKLLGIDNFTNLAYLKVEDINLPAIPFANSDDVDLGKKVVIMGYSQGKNMISLTEGIMSDFNEVFNLSGQTVASSEKLEGVFNIAFDRNKRYVGGPVIDYNGEMIAITGMKNINNEDVYFQIPINVVKKSMNKVANNEIEKSAKLGVYYLTIDELFKHKYGLSVNRGAMIYSSSGEQGLAIISDSSAEKAGLRIDDIIISIDGKNIDLEHPLSNYINEYREGDEAKFKILRKGKEMEINVSFS